jgi:hypothetical protein
MKIYSILKEERSIRSAGDLANAFDSQEWMLIATHLHQQQNNSPLGSNRDAIRSRMVPVNRLIGANQPPSQTPEDWNLKATRLGLGTDLRFPTWNDIYNYLQNALDEAEMPPEWRIEGASTRLGFSSWLDDTPEDRATDIGWVDGYKYDHTWDNIETLTDEYLIPWYNTLIQEKRPEEWGIWLGMTYSENEQPNVALTMLRNLRETILPQMIERSGSITKDQVDRRLFSWLKSADRMHRQYQEEQDNESD